MNLLGIGIGFNQKNKKILVRDDFNRANNTSALGVANTGQSWVASAGAWGIIDNKVYTSVSTSGAICHVESGKADVSVSTLITFATNEGIVFRLTDSANHLLVRISPTQLGLFKAVAGVTTGIGTVYSAGFSAGNTYLLKVVCKGDSIRVFLDGIERITATEVFNQTATKHGLRENSSTAGRFDDFIIEEN